MPNIAQMNLVQIEEMNITRNYAYSPNMSITGVEEDSSIIFRLKWTQQGKWTKMEILHWAWQYYSLDMVYE